MSRTQITETTVYTYPELSETAQEAVRTWWGTSLWEDGIAQESNREYWHASLEDDGWTSLDHLSYGDLYSQGGGDITWSGVFDYVPLLGARSYRITVGTRHVGGGSFVFTIDTDDDAPESLEDSVREHLRRQQQRFFWAFREEDEYQSSDEQVALACEANGYEFTEDGVLA